MKWEVSYNYNIDDIDEIDDNNDDYYNDNYINNTYTHTHTY